MAGFDPISLGISGGLGIGSTLLGMALTADDRKKQQDALANQISTTLGIPMAQAQTIAQSRLANYQANPELVNAQMRALQGLQNEASSGGMSAIDKQKLAEITGRQQLENQREQGALQQRFASQGMGGSGFDLQAALSGQQGAATRAGAQGTQAAADASQRALAALQQSGQLGGQIRGQDFGEQQAIANAVTNADMFNANARNQAYNQNFNRANAIAGAYGQQAGNYGANADRTLGQLTGAIGGTAGAFNGLQEDLGYGARRRGIQTPSYAGEPYGSGNENGIT